MCSFSLNFNSSLSTESFLTYRDFDFSKFLNYREIHYNMGLTD